MLTLLLLTMSVWIYMYIRRLSFLFTKGIDAQELQSPQQLQQVIPESVNRPAYNLANLFELPIVFYVLCLLAIFTNNIDASLQYLAWCFVVARIIHSIIHCSYNTVIHRFIPYFVASLCLWSMLIITVLAYL
ncbi:MAPEG family protein [Thalassotalea crassostreae]|nr:MAPEG family protein [Thalassotalea crassostreae]